MKTNNSLSNFKKGGFVVPVAIAVLVVASIGLLTFSWWGGSKKQPVLPKVETNTQKADQAAAKSTANDDQTLDSDSAAIDASLKSLDNSSADINSSFNDTPASL